MAGINWYGTGNAAGMFAVSTEGLTQGEFVQSPVTRFAIEGGISADTTAIWGGVALSLTIGAKGNQSLGSGAVKASTGAAIDGFCVSTQMYHAVLTPNNGAPQVGQNQSVHFARLGSGLRLAVQIDPTFADTLYGTSDTPVAWDVVNQKLIAVGTGTATAIPVKVISIQPNSNILTYNSGTDTVSWTTGPAAVIQL